MMMFPKIIIADLGEEYSKFGYSHDELPTLCSSSPNKDISESLNDGISSLSISEPSCFLISDNLLDENSRKDLIESLFESKTAEGVLFFDNNLLDLFSYGKSTGVSINFGSKTTIACIVEGHVINKTILEGGKWLNERIIAELSVNIKNPIEFRLNIQRLLVGDDVYNSKNLSQNEFIESNLGSSYSQIAYDHTSELINEINISNFSSDSLTNFKELFFDFNENIQNISVNEERFNMSKINNDVERVYNVTESVKQMVDGEENKNILYNNIYISGSGADVCGLEQKLRDNFKGCRSRIVYEPMYHTFMGGSILSSINETLSMFICSKDYEEFGSDILKRKSLLV